MRAVKLQEADRLAREMQNLLGVVEHWAPEMARMWNAREEDVTGVPELNGADGSPWFPIPRVSYQRVLTYDDMWPAYIWNFHAASQIVLRESLAEVVEYAAQFTGEDEPHCQSSAIVLNQRLWVDALSTSILKSVPQLLGMTFRQGAGVPISVCQRTTVALG